MSELFLPSWDAWLSQALRSLWSAGAEDGTPSGASRTHEGEKTRAPDQRVQENARREDAARNALWVTGLRSDDPAALREVMDAYFDDVAALAFHYVRRYDVARDVAQETFIRVWDQRKKLRDDTVILHFLRRVARNRSVDLLRGEARGRRLVTQVTEEYAAARTTENAGVSTVETDELAATVRRVAETLTPRVREVLLLYYERGLTPKEIASVLETAQGTVYKQLQKAIDTLAAAFRDWPR